MNSWKKWAEEHKIKISTSPDIAKTKTKCLYFSYLRDKKLPSPIFLDEKKLPWVNAWQHLGNELNVSDLSKPFQASMDEDTHNKRRKFIGKVHSLKQEFGFLCSSMLFNIISIYATSFYGSNLWLFPSSAIDRLLTSWNSMIRLVWNIPNTTHRYFLEEISETPHLKATLYQRYLVFVKSIINSKKRFLSALAQRVCHDQGSITRHNLNAIEKDSGCNDLLSYNPRFISSKVRYAPVPEEDLWKVGLLKELIQLRNNEMTLEDSQFTKDELQDLINFVATS